MATNPFVLFRVLTASMMFAGSLFLTAGTNPSPEPLTQPPVAFSGQSGINTPSPAPSTSQGLVEPQEKPQAQVASKPPSDLLVNLSGSIAEVDQCDGLVLWNQTPASWPQFIAAHDLCEEAKPWDPEALSGWKVFGNLQPGDIVNVAGTAPKLKSGSYVVQERLVVPSESNPALALKMFTKTPDLILQTCIPGTKTTLLVGIGAKD